MTNGLAIFLSVLTVCIAAVIVAAFYFLASLSGKVAKLNAATTVQEFRALTAPPPKEPKKTEEEAVSEVGSDGTLKPNILQKILKRDTVI